MNRKFLIAGYGSIGRRHLNNLQALGENDFLLYRSGKSTLDTDGIVDIPAESALEQALQQKPLAAIISNPTSMHLEVALPAAESGAHLLIEKPVAHALSAKLTQLQAVVKERQLTALVGFQFRFHPGLQKVKQLVDDGVIGRIVSAHAHWGEYLPDWHPWEDYRQSYSARDELGGGVVLTLSHPLDYLRWMLGEVREVSAMLGYEGLDILTEDTALINLQFHNGALGHVHLNYVERPPQHRLQITGTAGVIHWDNATGTTRWHDQTGRGWQQSDPPDGFERNTMFLNEAQHFLRCIAGDEQPVCTLDDGIQVLKIALAIKQSHHEQRPITL